MDCGIPFCHKGCPVNKLIPDWNNLVYRDQWRTAWSTALHQQFPGIHRPGLPGALRGACTLNISDNPVTIKTIECEIVDRGWEEGWIQPGSRRKRPASRSRSWARARRHGLRPAARARRPGVTLFEKTTASAACCATAFPISRWKST